MPSRYTVTFLALAVVVMLAGWAVEPWAARVITWWVAGSFGLVAVAYARVEPRFFLKRPNGRRSLAAWFWFGPYFGLNELGLGLFRLAGREAAWVEVAPNLFLGRRLTTREARRQGAPGWTAMLDLAAEFPAVVPSQVGTAYWSIPVLDATAPTLAELSAAVLWLEERVSRGPVFVHCALGHGRSATVVVGYFLATSRAASVTDGVTLVCSMRPGIGLQVCQRVMLERFQHTLADAYP